MAGKGLDIPKATSVDRRGLKGEARSGHLLKTIPFAIWTGLPGHWQCPSWTFLVLNRHTGHLPQVPYPHAVSVTNICTSAHSIFIVRHLFCSGKETEAAENAESFLFF